MQFEDLVKLYKEKKEKYGDKAPEHISELLSVAEEKHKKEWNEKPTPHGEWGQSWRAFKGKNLEKLIHYIIKDQVEKLGFKVMNGNDLRTQSSNLSQNYSQIKRNLLVDFGEFGSHLPDIDIIIYDPEDLEVIAVISSKVTLRERIAQTGYWKIKLNSDEITKHVKTFFITPDEDGTLIIKKPAKKGRAIAEIDTDGTYVMKENIEESEKVKKFNKFFEDIKMKVNEKRKRKH